MMRRFAFALMAALALISTACSPAQPEAGGAPTDVNGQASAFGGKSGAEEVAEQNNATQDRLEALAQARANGTFGTATRIENHAALGWSGEQLLNRRADDWEPAVAADPRDPYVYLTTTRYGMGKTCAKHCPSPFIALTISDDGGSTWGPQVPLCVCRGSGAQYDPTIEVAAKSGFVYAVYLNADRAGGFSTVFQKSTDHGQTWTEPVHVYGKVSWTDKPQVTTSPSGKHVYTSWNGPQGGDLYVGVSHDFGRTWTQDKLTESHKRYFFAYDGTVLPDGTVIFSESSLTYTGPGASVEGPIWHHAIISRDQGASWENIVVDKVPNGEPCVAIGCGNDFYTGQTSVTTDPSGHVVFAYEGPKVDLGPQRIYVRTSDDAGRTWGPALALSVAGENATGPRLASGGNGNVRVWYMQTANGDPDAWNVWYRSSGDGGLTWSSPVKLSDATSGAGYKNKDGFLEVYGDYGEIAVTSEGNTFAAWGEGFSWIGPGGTWFALQE